MPARLDVPSTPVAIRLFGSFEIEVGGRILPAGASRKEQWLLALLLLRHGRLVERSWLASTLWPDSRRSRVQLRDTLYDLRQALGSQGSRLFSPTVQTLQVDLTGADVDLLTFDAAVARGDSESLAIAVELYRGTLLEGCAEEWVFPEREAREQACLNALERLAKQALTRGEADISAGYLRRLICLDTLRESAICRLMEALAASGDHAEISQVYRVFRLRIWEELQIEPSAETTRLYQRLLERARRSVTVDAMVRVSESCESEPRPPTYPVSTAIAASPSSSLHCVPIPLSRLIGRESEREEIHNRFGSARLVTLTGAGGIGKTRLAISLCEERADLYSDGIWFVELAGLSDPFLVTQTVASTLGGLDSSGVPVLQSVTAFLKNKQALLVLDNCEHLLEACAQLAAHLLKQCPALHIMATSREGLGLTGEALWRVLPLPLPAPQELARLDKDRLSLLLSYEAIQLFVERAHDANSEFIVTPGNLNTIARICRRLDGIPLALELAAARVKAMPADQIDARLDQRFRLLTAGSRSALPRQQTLRALIDWSYDILERPQKRLLAQLSVFAGGWTLEAAECVCSGDGIEVHQVLDLLTSLVEKSLVVYEHREGKARYRLLETLREYSQDRLLESEVGEALRYRHLAFFLAFAEAAIPHLKSVGQAEWLELLEMEHDNLRSALKFTLFNGGAANEGPRLCTALWRFWMTRGHLSEGLDWCKHVLEGPACPGPTRERADVLAAAGNLSLKRVDFASAGAYFEECLSIRRVIGDQVGIATSLNNLGMVVDSCGDHAAAIAYFEESLAIHRESDYRSGMAWALRNLGAIAMTQGNDVSARTYFEDCLAIFREIGERNGIAAALSCLGEISIAGSDHVSARVYLEECLSIFREIGEQSGIVVALIHLVPVTAHLGDTSSARAYREECLFMLKGVGDREWTVSVLRLFARDALLQNQYERAAMLWGAAQGMCETPDTQYCYNKEVAACRQAMGETAFDVAFGNGRPMSIGDAIELALVQVSGN